MVLLWQCEWCSCMFGSADTLADVGRTVQLIEQVASSGDLTAHLKDGEWVQTGPEEH